MAFQDPMSSLNPALRVGSQLAEVSTVHGRLPRAAAWRRAVDRLGRVHIPQPEVRARQRPHQFSGGMRQRAVIAMGMMGTPRLLVADEPTTALDVTVQREILSLVREVADTTAAGVVFISHDMAVVSQVCHRVVVMYAGRVVEELPVAQLATGPAHPYTRALVACLPDLSTDRDLPLATIPGRPPPPTEPATGCAFAPRCAHASERCRTERPPLQPPSDGRRLACWHPQSGPVVFQQERATRVRPTGQTAAGPRVDLADLTVRFGRFTAVDGVTLSIEPGQTVGLVGESGSGKSTLAKALVGLVAVADGSISGIAPGQAQMVFQDPYSSLDPRMTVGASIAEGLRARRANSGAEVARLLELVSLDPAMAGRLPHALSGGQRQRVAVARALAARPRLLIADEITSALDVSVQGAILNLVREMREELGLSVLFISHNLAVVRYVADAIAVMRQGRLVEAGPTEQLLADPQDAYTRDLLAAVPTLAAPSLADSGLTPSV
jgi:peptide/nickel transport system ATP-binding protein